MTLSSTVYGQQDTDSDSAKVLVPKKWLVKGAKDFLQRDSCFAVGKILIEEKLVLTKRVSALEDLTHLQRDQIMDLEEKLQYRTDQLALANEQVEIVSSGLEREVKLRKKYKRQRTISSLLGIGAITLLLLSSG